MKSQLRILSLVSLIFWSGLNLGAQEKVSKSGKLATEDERNTVQIYRDVTNAVVHIASKEKVNLTYDEITPESGIGTGIIISQDGQILTNYHVIADSNQIDVTLNNGQKAQATLVGTAPQLDLAVIKIDLGETPLTVAKLGDSDELMVGQKVMAIGNPLAYHNTLSVGVVSSLDRTLEDLSLELKGKIIQTDAAINPGSSGGPLLNSSGEVVGINAAIATEGQNVGFAIPINAAKQILPDLIRYGHAMRPFVGFNALEINQYLSQLFNLPLREGLLVQEVIEGGPAGEAGLQGGQRMVLFNKEKIFLGGDIITEFNGVKSPTMDVVAKEISKMKPGNRVGLTVYRAGRPLKLTIVVAPMLH